MSRKAGPASVEEALGIAKALADKTRYQILSRLSAQPDSFACIDLRECLQINAATLSHHMKELETAGLVEASRDGKFVNYLLRRDTLERFVARLRADLLDASREGQDEAGQPPR